MNRISLQNVQFLMPNNFRKYPLKQDNLRSFQALLFKLKDFKAFNFVTKFKDFQEFSRCVRTPWLSCSGPMSYESVLETADLPWEIFHWLLGKFWLIVIGKSEAPWITIAPHDFWVATGCHHLYIHQLVVRARQLASVTQLVRALHRNGWLERCTGMVG